MGFQVTAVGCLAAPGHSSSWYITVIGIVHHQSAVPTLFAGFHTRNGLPHPMHSLAGFESGANQFCLGRAGTTCTSEVFCTSAEPSGLHIRPHVPALPGKSPSHCLLHTVIQFAAQRCLCCRLPRLDNNSGHVVLREQCPSNGCAVCRWETCLQPVPAPKVAPPQIAVI